MEKEEIKDLCVEGLLTDGGNHKQWFLEEILKKLGYDLKEVSIELAKDDYLWEKGIPP